MENYDYGMWIVVAVNAALFIGFQMVSGTSPYGQNRSRSNESCRW